MYRSSIIILALPIVTAVAASCGSQDPLPQEASDSSIPDAQVDGDSSQDSGPADASPDFSIDVSPDTSLDVQHDISGNDVVTDPVDEFPADPGLDLGHGVLLRPSKPVAGQLVRLEYHGNLDPQSNVNVHYGFNGWNNIAGPALLSQDDGTGNLDYYVESPMSKSSSGVWMSELTLPTDARALHVAFYSETNGSRSWDSNGGQDFSAGFPLVLFGPVLTWDGTVQPQDGIIVNFHTGWPCKANISYGMGGALTKSAMESTASRAHFVRLSGLQAGAKYSYQVACDGNLDNAVRSFETAAANPSKFEFVVMGDMQENGEANRWKRTADFVQKNHANASFIVLTGDLPANDKTGLWWTFFDQGRELLGSHPVVPVKGNHDVNLGNPTQGQTTFERLFQLDASSGAETWYTIRYGAAAFLVLDSEYPDGFTKDSGNQFAWTKLAMQDPKVTGASWVFASVHRPPYNAGARHFGEQGTYRDLTSLLDGKVDWVFSGHEHLYQRVKPMRYNAALASSTHYGRGPADGIGYLVVPAAAAWPEKNLIASTDSKANYRDRLAFPINPPPGTDTVPSENGWVVVSIDGKLIRIQTWGNGGPELLVDPHIVDQVSYSH